jgi:hypothetical protein
LTLTSPPVQIKDCEWGRGCGMYGEEEICMQGQMAKPDGKRPLGRPRLRWKGNIKVDLK